MTDPNDVSEEMVLDETAEQPAPPGGLIRMHTTKKREETRRHLAFAMFGLLGVLTLAGLYGWLIREFDEEQMESLSLVFAPVITLMGTILGFYFASSHD